MNGSYFEHVADNAFFFTGSSVLRGNTVAEDFQSWVATHFESVGQICVNSGIDFGKGNRRIVLLQSLCSLGVLRGQFLAVSTPRSIKFHQNDL